MLRLLVVLIFIGMIATLASSVFWYFRTPQPIGVRAQVEYAQQLVEYQYHKYEQLPGGDEVSYWQPLADKGNSPAQTHIAELYFSAGENDPSNYTHAVQYLNTAANNGLPTAQNALGVALRKGLGITQDKVEAYKWFSLAAGQGMDLAQKNLEDITPELTEKEIEQADLRIQLWLKHIRTF